MREASGGRGQERMLQQQQRPGPSGPHQSGPARAPLSPYSSGSKGQPSHRVSICLCRQTLHRLAIRHRFAPQSAAAARLPVDCAMLQAWKGWLQRLYGPVRESAIVSKSLQEC